MNFSYMVNLTVSFYVYKNYFMTYKDPTISVTKTLTRKLSLFFY